MNTFIIFIKFLSWIVASCARLAKLIGEERSLKVLEEGPTTKIKNIISIKKLIKKGARGGSGPH